MPLPEVSTVAGLAETPTGKGGFRPTRWKNGFGLATARLESTTDDALRLKARWDECAACADESANWSGRGRHNGERLKQATTEVGQGCAAGLIPLRPPFAR